MKNPHNDRLDPKRATRWCIAVEAKVKPISARGVAIPDKFRSSTHRVPLAFLSNHDASHAKRGTAAAVFLLLLICGGCGGNDAAARAIEAAIQQDRDAQQQVANEMGIVEKFWSPSSTMQKYIEALRAIDLSDCPGDFQEAYLQHIHAWERLRIEKANNEGLAAFLKGYFGDRDSLMRSLEADEAAQKEIAESWFEVERIALKHGASLQTAKQRTDEGESTLQAPEVTVN